MNIIFEESPNYLTGYKETIAKICETMFPEDTENINVSFNQRSQVYSSLDARRPRVTIAGKYRYRMPVVVNGVKDVFATNPTQSGVMTIFFFHWDCMRFYSFKCSKVHELEKVIADSVRKAAVDTGLISASELMVNSATLSSDSILTIDTNGGEVEVDTITIGDWVYATDNSRTIPVYNSDGATGTTSLRSWNWINSISSSYRTASPIQAPSFVERYYEYYGRNRFRG